MTLSAVRHLKELLSLAQKKTPKKDFLLLESLKEANISKWISLCPRNLKKFLNKRLIRVLWWTHKNHSILLQVWKLVWALLILDFIQKLSMRVRLMEIIGTDPLLLLWGTWKLLAKIIIWQEKMLNLNKPFHISRLLLNSSCNRIGSHLINMEFWSSISLWV